MWRQPSVLKLILDTNEHVDWVGSEQRERPFSILSTGYSRESFNDSEKALSKPFFAAVQKYP